MTGLNNDVQTNQTPLECHYITNKTHKKNQNKNKIRNKYSATALRINCKPRKKRKIRANKSTPKLTVNQRKFAINPTEKPVIMTQRNTNNKPSTPTLNDNDNDIDMISPNTATEPKQTTRRKPTQETNNKSVKNKKNKSDGNIHQILAHYSTINTIWAARKMLTIPPLKPLNRDQLMEREESLNRMRMPKITETQHNANPQLRRSKRMKINN